MASTLLEETRQLHEDLEKAERLIVKQYRADVKGHKDKLLQSHRVRKLLDLAQDRAARLIAVYKDEDGQRRQEIAELRGDNVFGNFYDRLRELREYHRKFPNNDLTEGDNDEALLGPDPSVPFSGEEGLGRYLDLHEQHQAYLNSRFGKKSEEGGHPMDYYTYVSSLADFSGVPRAQRLSRPYRDYLSSLLGYLEGFYRRTQPLAQLGKQLKKAEEEFDGRWAAGEVAGWEDRGLVGGANGEASSSALDLDAFDSVEELEQLGGERLKEALTALGLKCGGTVAQRAQRLWSTKGKDLSQLGKSLFAKGGQAVVSEEERARAEAAARAVALQEAKIAKLVDMLSSVIEDTKGRIEKKQAQTYEELLAEQAEAEEEVLEEESDEEEYIYNPLKLPLGWDGKPIPYWLYKLHGLNMEFKCEICGNASYWGRRAFERHFKEWRHQNGMKALGIPNTRQFFEVTTIADALALWKNLQEREKGGFKAEQDEEFEDSQGNVYNRKTYEDLRRQGLI